LIETIYGYVRQTLGNDDTHSQERALRAGCAEIIRDDAVQAVLAGCLENFVPGDQLAVTALDRLAFTIADLSILIDARFNCQFICKNCVSRGLTKRGSSEPTLPLIS